MTAQEKLDTLIWELRGNLRAHKRFQLADRRLNAAIKETDSYNSVDPEDLGKPSALSYDGFCEGMATQLVGLLAGDNSLLCYQRGRVDTEDLPRLLANPHVIVDDGDWVWILPASAVDKVL